MKSHAAAWTAGIAGLVLGFAACQDGDRSRQDTTSTSPGPRVETSQAPSATAPQPQTPAQQQRTATLNANVASRPQEISGDVLRADDQEVLLSERGEPRLRLQIGASTQVRVDGRAANASEIREGSQVRASYLMDAHSGEPQALSIDATSPTRPATPAPVESGESTPGVPR
jgi:colicin import membrane protein